MPRKKKVHANGTRVTVTKALLNRVVSLGASHHKSIKELRASIRVAPAKHRKKVGKKKGRKKTGKKRGRRRATR